MRQESAESAEIVESAAGFTLIELLVCMAIVAFLALQASPGIAEWRARKAADGLIRELLSAVAMARAHAIAGNVTVTFCRSADGSSCGGNWRDGSILFRDANADRIVNDDDRVLFRLTLLPVDGTLEFRSFQNRQYLQIDSRGFTLYQNGNFTYCPANGDARLARQLIISLSGRTRLARDTDGDGIVEDSQGRALSCD
ncbi:MAG: GspH/FimT family pseudopilin [Pseudomonadota bacterium]|nr:GspH/FimT family pseudopilin [Pseudomonadota bacterium]